MGQSTNAILAFGFNVAEEDEMPESLAKLLERHEMEVDDALADDHGVVLPEYASGSDYKEYRAAFDSALAGIKIDLVPHCSGDYTMYFMAARGSAVTAHRGTPVAVEADAGKYGPEVIDAMRAFCERHSIEWQEPKWHIFSMWM